jgi:hypothetical protein
MQRASHDTPTSTGNGKALTTMKPAGPFTSPREVMRRWGAGVTLAALWLGSASFAQARAPGCEKGERFTLKNGVEVVLSENRSLPAVAVVSSVHVGSRNDPPGYEGLAHFVEHLTFRPVPGFASAFELYEEVGATGVNALTFPDTTDYVALVPAAQLERAIWIESRRLAMGLDALEEQPAGEERQVVLREHAWRYGTGPQREAQQATIEALFPPEHPYHRVLATKDSLEGLRLSDARWFFAQHYRPERVRLVLVGDFDPASAKSLVEHWFGALAATAPVSDPSSVSAPPQVTECRWAKQKLAPSASRIVVETRSRNERLEVYWPMAADEEPELWRGVFSLLARQVGDAARETGLAAGVNINLVRGELGHYWVLSMDLVPGEPFDKAEPLVQSLLDDVRRVSRPELDAESQAMELDSRSGETALLGRAQSLALRECTVSRCVEPTEQLSPETMGQSDRFLLQKALVVERRFAIGTSLDGDVEVLP